MHESKPPFSTAEVLSTRRRDLMALLAATHAADTVLLTGHSSVPRNYAGAPLPYRQDSTFLYFTGIHAPDAFALINAHGRCSVYLPPADPHDAFWHGETESFAAQRERLGLDEVKPLITLPADVRLTGDARVGVAPCAQPWRDRAAKALRAEARPAPSQHDTDRSADEAVIDAVIRIRLRRDRAELQAMRHAMPTTAAGFRAAMGCTRPGVTDRDVESALRAVFFSRGCATAYDPIATPRGQVLHGHSEGLRLADGQLFLLDAGAESPEGPATDVTRTWPVSGKFDARQRDVYSAVLEAQKAAIAKCRVGGEYAEVHTEACRVLTRAAIDWGILAKGDVDGLVERGAHAVFYPHGTGHLIGMDVHDLELFGDRAGYAHDRRRSDIFGWSFLRLDRPLEAEMAVTVEPGFYVSEPILSDPNLRDYLGDSVRWSQLESWVGFGGIRIEDDIVVTVGEPEVLSAEIPKEIDAVEAAVGNAAALAEVWAPAR